MPPRLALPPLEFWLRHQAQPGAELVRRSRNCLNSPTPATSADAPSSPMPVTLAARLASLGCRARAGPPAGRTSAVLVQLAPVLERALQHQPRHAC